MDALVALLAFPVAAWIVPGALLSRWIWPEARPVERLATALALGPAVVVPVVYLPHYLLRTPQTPLSILAVAGLISVGLLAALRWAPRARSATSRRGWGDAVVLAGLVGTTAWLTAVTGHWGSCATDWFAPCAHKSALFLLEDGRGGGLDVYAPYWQRWVSHVVMHAVEPGYGLEPVLVNHRIGSTAAFAHPLALLGVAAPLVTTAYYMLAVGALGAALARRVLRSPWAVLLVAVPFQLGVHHVASYMLNENVIALTLGMAALLLLVALPTRGLAAAASGAALGLSVGIRPETAFLAAPALWILLRGLPAGGRRRAATLLILGLVAAYLPWAWTNVEVFGNPLANPALANAATPVRLFGGELTFHPLNWPFASTLLRPGHEPFPTLFLLPLEQIQAFGALLWLLVLAGGVALGWRRALPYALWLAPITLVLLLLVSLDPAKRSYVLLGYAPLPLLAGHGLAQLRSLGQRARLGLAVGATAALALVPMALRALELPVDPRPQYGDAPDAPVDLAARRAGLTAPRLLPEAPSGGPPLAITWEILTHAGPSPRAEPPGEAPTVVWRLTEHARHRLNLRLWDAPVIPPTLAEVGVHPRWTTSFVGLSLALQTPDPAAAVAVDWDDTGLRIDVTVGVDARAATRYLWLGARDRRLGEFVPVTVRLNGHAQPLRYLTVTRAPAAPPALRLVANHPWHFRPEGPAFVLRPELWPESGCGWRRVGGQLLGVGHRGYLGGGERPLRVRSALSYPPPQPRCAELVDLGRAGLRGPGGPVSGGAGARAPAPSRPSAQRPR